MKTGLLIPCILPANILWHWLKDISNPILKSYLFIWSYSGKKPGKSSVCSLVLKKWYKFPNPLSNFLLHLRPKSFVLLIYFNLEYSPLSLSPVPGLVGREAPMGREGWWSIWKVYSRVELLFYGISTMNIFWINIKTIYNMAELR